MMDYLDDNLSSEDLRLLEAYRISLDAVALQGTSHSVYGVPFETQHEKPSSLGKAASGYSMFPAAPEQGRKRKRTKFEDPRRRAEVAQVRREGACMRCHRNKIPVRLMLTNYLSLLTKVRLL